MPTLKPAETGRHDAATEREGQAAAARRASPTPAHGLPLFLQQSGEPLAPPVRAGFERLLDADFSDVRVHTGPAAARHARAVAARAFAAGSHIVMGEGEYQPHGMEGRRLLGHELTHVRQAALTGPTLAIRRQRRAEPAARDWSYEVARLTTTEIEAEIHTAREYLLTLSASDAAYHDASQRLVALEHALVSRQGAAIGFQQDVQRLREVTRGRIEGATVYDVPGLYSVLSRSSEGLFVYGVFSGYVTEIPPGAIEDHIRDLQENWLEYYGGYLVGLPIGLWHGLTGLVEGLWMLVQLGFWTSPIGIQIALVGEAAELARDPRAYWAARRRDYEQLRAIAAALQAFGEEFRADPTIVMQASGDLGFAVGQQLAGAVTDFMRLDAFSKGRRTGDIVGQVLFEVLLEIVLALATQGVGNLLRGVAAVGQGARAGGRIANVVRRMLEASPALRRLIRAIAGAEDVGDVARLTERATTGGPPTSVTPRGGGGGHRGATAEGLGESFSYEYFPETPGPVVERGRVPTRTDTPVTPTRTETAPERRGFTREEIHESLGETTEGTHLGSSPGAPEELNIPSPQQAEELAGLPRGRFGTRAVWEPPPNATPRPPDSAPAAVRRQWLRDRLQLHVDQARARLEVEGLTPGQAARVGDVPTPGVQPMPGQYPAFRGSRIDQFAKESIMQDPDLAEVITAPDFVGEPDVLDSVLPDWFDITTRGEWQRHLQRYQQRYGGRASRLATEPQP